jgi:hypothetical protein
MRFEITSSHDPELFGYLLFRVFMPQRKPLKTVSLFFKALISSGRKLPLAKICQNP